MKDDEFLEIAASILDGTPVRWETLPDPGNGTDRGFLAQLRLLDQLTRANHAAQSPIGTRWGTHLIVERIGSGTFGDVYKARDTTLDRDVALKLLRASTTSRHLTEGRLLARVRHPNVITVHGAAEHEGISGIWMELVEGRTLAQLVAEHGPFTPSEVVAIGLDVCRALGAVHASGLLHGDVKAQNVMRESCGRILLMDFGTGRVAGDAALESTLAGTPLSVAPEVLNGEPTDASADVYGVGVLLYFLLTGAFPVEGGTLGEIRAAHAAGTRTPLCERRPDIPRPLAAVIERAASPAKEERFQTANEIEAAIVRSATPRRWVRVATVAAAVVALAAGSWVLASRRSTRADAAATSESPKHWAMVVPFENHTNDRTFDDLLHFAVERELFSSDVLSPVPRDRVDDALRLMRVSPDVRLDAALGRQVCLRDGEIDAMITGRLDVLGTVLSLTARLTRPSDGRLLADVTEQASGPSELLAAVHRASDRLKRAAGDTPRAREPNRAGLERVTTPSLNALRLYSESYESGRTRRWAAARELAAQAVADDPSFASGWIWLAWARRNTQRPVDEVRAAAEHALRLADEVAEPERLWIVGSYHFMITNDMEKGAAAYEALIKLRPTDHVARDWAIGNLASLLSSLGRSGEALPYLLQRADARPWSANVNWSAASAILETSGDIGAAKKYADRILRLDDQEPALNQEYFRSWARMLPMYEKILAGDIAGGVAIHRQLLGEVERSSDAATRDLASAVLNSALFFGRLDDARRANAHASELHDPALFDALISYYAGDAEKAKRQIAPGESFHEDPLAIWLYARLGDTARGEQILRTDWKVHNPSRDAVEGDLALSRGDIAKGIRLMDEAIRKLSPAGTYYREVEVLATAWMHSGEADRAIALLKPASARRAVAYYTLMPFSPFWIRDELLLAEAYEQSGRHDDAKRVADGLARLLAFADPDFPMLARVKALQTGGRRTDSTHP